MVFCFRVLDDLPDVVGRMDDELGLLACRVRDPVGAAVSKQGPRSIAKAEVDEAEFLFADRQTFQEFFQFTGGIDGDGPK